MSPLLTVADVAAILKRSAQYVTKLIVDGHLKVVQLPNTARPGKSRGRKDYRVRQQDLEAFLASSVVAAALPPKPAGPRPKVRTPRPSAEPAGPGIYVWDGKSRIKW